MCTCPSLHISSTLTLRLTPFTKQSCPNDTQYVPRIMDTSCVLLCFVVLRYGYIYLKWVRYYCDVIMSTVSSQITSLAIVYSTIYSDADQIIHQSSASLAFLRGTGPVNSPHKWPVTRIMFPFDDVIMITPLAPMECYDCPCHCLWHNTDEYGSIDQTHPPRAII